MRSSEPTELPRWVQALAVGLPVLLVAGVLVGSAVIRSQGAGPLPLTRVPAPDADSPECARLIAALPGELADGLDRRPLVAPAPAGAVAWGEPPVVLRCGLGRPVELTPSSRLLEISGVQFLELRGPDATSWVVVDRPVYVAVTLPDGSGSAALQQVSAAVRVTLPA